MNMRLKRLSPVQFLALTFLGLILAGTFLLMLPWSTVGEQIGFVDALFTATSAVCVTGLVVVDTGTRFSFFGQAVILLLIQLGGLGLMTVATMVAVILGKRITFRDRLIIQESFNQFTLEGMVRLVKYIVLTTFVIQGIGAFILFLRFRPLFGPVRGLWFAVFHAVSAFCNAGFDLFGNFRSLEAFTSDPVVNLVIISLIVLGGIGFSVIADVYTHRGFKGLSLHTKLVMQVTLALIVIPSIVIGMTEWNNALAPYDLTGKVLGSIFTAVTTRTAGFNTVPIATLSQATTLLLIGLMFIGASPASTGGGIKTTTFAMIVLSVLAVLRQQPEVVIGGRRIPVAVTFKSLAVAVMALVLALSVTFLLLITEEHAFLDILFETISALGTVGLSRGITTTLSTVGRLALVVTMFAGRVGPLTLAFAFSVKTDPCANIVRYPEGKIIVG
ncbi:MAG: TrkH family potassium uptake protein [Peptococcaceae bacterium]|nr:TrkH family potassium uptake protein [Peptococcaceae bacterium]